LSRGERSTLQKNSITCAHWGELCVRLSDKTPIINRSDGKDFHLAVFSGPRPRRRAKGGFYHNQIMCDFTYAHRRIHDTEHAVIVTLHRDKTEQEIGCQIQDLADKLAELVAQGKKLEFSYTFNKGQLIPCFTK
jgi:hypothetical protein